MEKLKNISVYIFLFLAMLGAARSLYGPGYFNMHDDLQVMRLLEMEKCFKDGQIPCRWAPDMAWGYGQPMFNFYSAFPYYLGYLIRILTPLSFMGTVLLLFNISLVASGIGMYLLAKEFWGRLGGILSAVLYVYAPYHLLDIYIRGALSESYSLAILPYLWLSIYLFITEPKYKNFIFTSITIALLLMTHNLSTLMYLPFTAVWAFYWLVRKGNWKSSIQLVASVLMGTGVASFFILPVLFEKSLIQTEFLTVDYLNYEAHFVTLKQLFIQRNWGHGPSIFGPEDEISFQIGWPHWFLFLPLSILIIKNFKKNITKKNIFLIMGLTVMFIISIFLTHPRAIFIWKAIPDLAIVQFPWRFLGPAIFLMSFAVGAIFMYKFKLRKIFFVFILTLTVILNFDYAVPWNRSYQVRDEEKLSGIAFELQRKSAILDYLPKTAEMAPKEAAFDKPLFTSGEGEVKNYKTSSSTFSFDLEVFTDEASVEIPVMYFPNWTVISGGKIVPHSVTGDYGLISVTMPQGKHILEGRFMDTKVRIIGNILSLFSALLLFGGYLYFSNKSNVKKSL